MLEFSEQSDYRSTPISLYDGYAVVWKATSIAIGRNGRAADEEVASPQLAMVFGELFRRIDTLKEEAELFAQAYPELGAPRITIGTLTSTLNTEIDAIYSRHQAETGVCNPFAVQDERLDALNSAYSLIDIAFADIVEPYPDLNDSDY